ncbi:enolase C-terminal domain-like protein [Pedobacter frigoris]|uniref:enolase C-terminal domain-like protein n=1 Tax=Pedobacter frigoris TaxID=2571272 RepID=UPI00292DF76A|nr:enolase C-terminal domain-like protein [Pedobacter frigoris]
MNSIENEIFNISTVQIRRLQPVKAVIPFQDATMGPFEEFSLSVITLTDTDGNIGEAPVFSAYTNILEMCMLPILFHSHHVSYKELYHKLYWSIRNEGFRGAAAALLGQVDLALYDLAARRKGKPLHEYLNAGRNSVSMYCSGGGTNYSHKDLEKEMDYFLNFGTDCIKMKVGKNFGSSMQEDIERVKFVRKLIGSDIELAVDANQIWNVDEALQFIRAVEHENIAWFEEPVHSASLTDIALLCEKCPVPISFGESERSGKVFSSLRNAGVQHFQPTPYHLSSMQEWMDVRDLAIQSGLDFSSGGYSLYTAAIVAAAPEKFRVEYLFTLMHGLESYFAVCPKLENGHFILPQIEGLPIRIDWDYWQRKDKIKMNKIWSAEKTNYYSPLVQL